MQREDIRLAIYKSFAGTGRAPDLADLTATCSLSREDVIEGLRDLAHDRHIVLDSDDHIVMAHPFSSVPLGFSVMGATTLWWGGCAWDSFALPHLIPEQSPVLVATRCPSCDKPLAWNVGRDEPPPGDEIAHFLTPVSHMWDDVVRTCDNQRLFCSSECVQAWLEDTDQSQGYVMDLATLWQLARNWYAGRLARGYVRREPTEASAYFRDAGLTGSFWGL